MTTVPNKPAPMDLPVLWHLDVFVLTMFTRTIELMEPFGELDIAVFSVTMHRYFLAENVRCRSSKVVPLFKISRSRAESDVLPARGLLDSTLSRPTVALLALLVCVLSVSFVVV